MKDNQVKNKSAKGATRQHILEIASDLFYYTGIRAVGVDTIVARSGVAKTTLYDHFASKDELINAYLEGRDSYAWQMMEETLAKHPDSPRQQLIDVVESFENLIAEPESVGCPFLNAVAEFPELDQPGHQIALAHKQKLRAKFAELAQAAGVKAASQLADQFMLLTDGAFAAKRVYRSAQSPALQLKATAEMLLEAHLASSKSKI